MNNHFARFTICSILTLLIPACMGVRHLQDDEYLLRRQHIEGNDAIADEELEELYQIEANKKFPLIPFAPYVWIYHLGKNNFDSTKIEGKIEKIKEKYSDKIQQHEDNKRKKDKLANAMARKIEKKRRDLAEGNILMRWGEPVSKYDEKAVQKTVDQMKQYFQNRGYFNSSIDYKTNLRGKRAFVHYLIEEDNPHIIDSVRFYTSDTTIYRIIEAHQQESLIKTGDNYDQNNLVKERERIERLLKNQGYFDFSRQYIAFDVITDIRPYGVEVNMVINDPVKRGYHKQFTIDSVLFVTDANATPRQADRSFFNYRGITYQYYEKKFSKKILDQRVFIYPDQTYSIDNTLNTQRQLAYLDNFKFININYDTTGNTFIANIFTSPLNKYAMTNEVGLNVTQGYPGPFYNLSLKDRNIFGGLENLEITGYFGFEGVASATTKEVYSSVESGAKLALIFPQFIMPSSQKFKQKAGLLNPNTVIRSGYNYTNRPEYRRANFTNALVYNWQRERRRAYSFTLSELSYINSDTDIAFDSLLIDLENDGNPLINSFEPSFVSAMNFMVVYNFNPDDFYGNKASLLKFYIESGGAMFNFFDPRQLEINKPDTIQYFQYLKFSSDFRRHITMGENKGIATRFNFGVAYPYGKNKTLPYEKFFFAGGSNSLRAWPPRRLGPGSQKPRESENPEKDGPYDYSIEKPGEILLEANVEYRSKLIGFLDWAFFIDAGNVWKFYENPVFPGADFKFNRFYKEIAVGMGVGLRLNFSFLVIRFDYGVKMIDPARDEGQRWIGDNLSITNWRGEPGQALWNIAIGYPF
ncbi:MAG: BamA/TamA family outer membrane protein [Cyclobacteriaceae bacterium]|nr:BamA/TamA family outer membrane protein [Cyclobacteriaceae bacterium]